VAFYRPLCFAVFIESIVCKVRQAADGASIGRHYLGYMLYADDIMLVCNSIAAMQRMLDPGEAEMLHFSFDTAKSVASRIFLRFRHACAPLVSAGASLEYVHQTKYLRMCPVEGIQTVQRFF